MIDKVASTVEQALGDVSDGATAPGCTRYGLLQ